MPKIPLGDMPEVVLLAFCAGGSSIGYFGYGDWQTGLLGGFLYAVLYNKLTQIGVASEAQYELLMRELRPDLEDTEY